MGNKILLVALFSLFIQITSTAQSTLEFKEIIARIKAGETRFENINIIQGSEGFGYDSIVLKRGISFKYCTFPSIYLNNIYSESYLSFEDCQFVDDNLLEPVSLWVFDSHFKGIQIINSTFENPIIIEISSFAPVTEASLEIRNSIAPKISIDSTLFHGLRPASIWVS